MDQTASMDQSFLWYHRKCGKNPNLDCHRGLYAGGNLQKATEIGVESLHNSTDFELPSFRKYPILEALANVKPQETNDVIPNQLNLFH